MLGIRMTSALFEAVADRFQAELVASLTLVDACCHAVSRHLIFPFAHVCAVAVALRVGAPRFHCGGKRSSRTGQIDQRLTTGRLLLHWAISSFGFEIRINEDAP